MPIGATIGIIVAILIVAGVVYFAYQASMRRRLRTRFGPEYDRVVAQRGDRAAAEHDLTARLRRHDSLPLRDLSPETRARVARDWAAIQQQFVDAPQRAVESARSLVVNVADERGYDRSGGESQWLDDLTVDHAAGVTHYRDAATAATGSPGEDPTETLRTALLHLRATLDDLMGEPLERDARRVGATANGPATADPSVNRTAATPSDMTSSDMTSSGGAPRSDAAWYGDTAGADDPRAERAENDGDTVGDAGRTSDSREHHGVFAHHGRHR